MTSKIALGVLIAILFVALLALFCMVLIKLYSHKIKTYTRLIYEKELDSQKALNNAVIETQELVLNNISQDLHDDAGQQLTYINLQLENLKLDSPEMQAALEPISQSVANLSGSVRKISHSLNNQLLLQQDLPKAIKSEVERLKNNGAVKISFHADGPVNRNFNSNEKIFIYRIFQEITNNCFKHAKATSIDIRLKTHPFFEMVVTDNGKGFDHSENPNTLGLQGMAKRAEIINYKLEIQSKAGEGTRILLSENNS
jgi:signal transduction histidine kinase